MHLNRRPILLALLSLAVYLLLWIIVPHSRFLLSHKSALQNLIVICSFVALFIAVQVAIVRWAAAINVRPYVSALGMLACLAGFAVVVIYVAGSAVSNPSKWMLQGMHMTKKQFDQMPAIVKYLSSFGATAGPWSLLSTIFVIGACICLGYTLSFLLREKNIMLPVAVFAAYTDFWTVLWGPTSQMVRKAPTVVQAVSAAIPTPGAGSIQPISFIGPGDFIFMAMFFAAICRHKMEPSKTYWLLVPLLAIGMIAVLLGVFPVGLPALILVGISVAIANRKHFKLQKQEIISTIVVAVILVLSAVVMYPYLTRK